MNKEEMVSNLFLLMRVLNNTPRQGWLNKGIKRDRVESVADHIYGCQMLAYAMYSEFDYDIDINKVILMLAIHEIGETIIGDITPDEMDGLLKSEYEKREVIKLLDSIPNGEYLKELFLEFENKETNEAKFAYQIDKAECDLQAKLYDQDGSFVHLYPKGKLAKDWINFDLGRINFDDNFRSVINYALYNDMDVLGNSNNPIQNVVSFYTATNSLKNKQRVGEKHWKVNCEHYGSVAEHIYNAEMLAIIIKLVYGVDIDIVKVINMLSVHEIGENVIGDISALSKNDDDRKREFDAAKAISSILDKSDIILSLLSEFNDCISNEAVYAKFCDKLTPDIISKIYDELGLIDLNDQDGNPFLKNVIVKKHLENGKSFSEMWILYGQEVYKYPYPFMNISDYVLNNKIGFIKEGRCLPNYFDNNSNKKLIIGE